MTVVGVDESVVNQLLGAGARPVKDENLIARTEISAGQAHRLPILRLEICRKLFDHRKKYEQRQSRKKQLVN